MKYTSSNVTESQIPEISALVVNNDTLISLDLDDVKSIMSGHEGVLYEGSQDENENHEEFMKSFFKELSSIQNVTKCHSILMFIKCSEKEGLMMDEMNIIHDFMEVLPENSEAKWGMSVVKDDSPMKIVVVVTV